MTVKNVFNYVITTDNHVLKVKRCKKARQNRYVVTASSDPAFYNKTITQYRVADANNVMQFQAVLYNKTTPQIIGHFIKA